MDDKRRTEIERRLAAMPKGHYKARDDWSPDWWAVYAGDYVGDEGDERLVCDCTEDTATFIAHAPADIRDLLADNAALAQELARALEMAAKEKVMDIEERIERLPKWAQQHIDGLCKDAEWYKGQLGLVGNCATDIRWNLHIDDVGGNIPSRARVLFTTNGGTLECVIRDGHLYIRGANTERPVVRSEAYNVIQVDAEK